MPKVQKDNSEKLRKKLIQEQQKRIRPGECQKYIRAVIDEAILQPEVGQSLLSQLTDATVNHIIRKQKCKRVITWERNVGQQIFNQTENNALCNLTEKFESESQLLRVFSVQEFLAATDDSTIHEIMLSIKSHYPSMRTTLAIVGILPKGKYSLEIESSFVELQILYECSIHFLQDSTALSCLVERFTKAVAEIPFKKQKSALFAGSSQFLLNDNKDCVRVDGSNGLGRLWQQHLSRLPLVTLDVAQTILNNYPCPKKLLREFECHPDGPNCLANLRISRGIVPLSSERRIGEVLSKKLHTLYNSMDPDEIL